MDISLSIRNYLKSHGIKQSFVSEGCGWTKQKTSLIVRGRRKITADELAAICDTLGVPYDFFYQAATLQDSA